MNKSDDKKESSPQNNLSLDQLSSHLATAIGKPAKSILSLTEELLDTALSALQREQVRNVQTFADNLLTIIHDLSDYSKIGLNKVALANISFSLRDCVTNVSGNRVFAAREKGLLLRIEIDGDVPDQVAGDPTRLGHVLGHLLDAAIGATETGEVTLQIDPEFITQNQATLVFAVIDTRTIYNNNQTSIETEQSDQMGDLGLIVAESLIKAMGGKLKNAKSKEGETTLSFSIPMGIVSLNWPKPMHPHFTSLVALPVLIVSDDEQERDELSKLFQGWHMRPLEADSGEMALAMLENAINVGRPVALVVFTNRFQGQDGFMFAMQVKRHPEIRATALIMLTNDGRRGDAIKCRENGIAGYLPKPINPHDLREVVSTILGVAGERDHSPTLVTRHFLREKRHGAVVLLIEDDRDTQLLVAHFLDRSHFSVVLAAGYEEANSKMEQQKFDVILLDMELQFSNSLQLITKIREVEGKIDHPIPVIGITNKLDKKNEKSYRDMGVTDFITKPLLRDVLLAMLYQYIRTDTLA